MGSKYKYEKPIYQAKAKVTNTTRKGSLIVTKESTMEIIKKQQAEDDCSQLEKTLPKTVPTIGHTFIRSLMPHDGGFGAKQGSIGVVYMVVKALRMVISLRQNKDLMEEIECVLQTIMTRVTDTHGNCFP